MTHSLPLSIAAALALTLAVGCSSQESDVASAETGSAALPDDETVRRALCEAAPTTSTPIDDELIAAQQALATHADRALALVDLGKVWVRKARQTQDGGYYENADACASSALALQRGMRAALHLRGLAQLDDHNFRGAEQTARSLLRDDTDDQMAWGMLSDALLELGRFEDAAAAVQRMVDLKPNLPSYARASWLAWLQGDDASAKLYIQQAISAGKMQRDPEPAAWAITQAADVFWHAGDARGAEAGYDVALARFADYPPALVGKARSRLVAGDAVAAVALLKSAADKAPSVKTSWLLGDALTVAGDEAGAARAYAAVKRDGRRHDKRTLALFFATRNENLDEAVALARAEHEARPGVYSRDALAFALARQGQGAEAAELIATVEGLGKSDARLIFQRGVVRMAAGDVDGGRALIASALARNPAFDATLSAEARTLLAKR